MRALLTIVLALSLFSLSGCENPKASGMPTLPPDGTRILIKQHGYEIIAEVASTNNNLVGIDYYWQGEKAFSQKLYHGIVSVWSKEGDTVREVEINASAVDSLFPLEVGKEASFTGIRTNITSGDAQKVDYTYQVVKKSSVNLQGRDITVYLIEVSREVEGRNAIFETIYYAPEKGLVLKSVTRRDNGQSFWRVLEIEEPSNKNRRNLQNRNRRSGTIAI